MQAIALFLAEINYKVVSNGNDVICGEATNMARGPFLEAPGKLTGPVSFFEIEVSRKVGCVLTSNEDPFVSLAENFTVSFSKVLKLPSGMENQTA